MEVLSPERLNSVLSDAVERLRREFGACEVYLFGSYAYGAPSPDSDLDLLVVVPSSSESFFRRSGRAHHALSGLGVPKDVLVVTQAEFDQRSKWMTSVEREVKDKGRLLHAA